jgi:ubiquitin-protein ligase
MDSQLDSTIIECLNKMKNKSIRKRLTRELVSFNNNADELYIDSVVLNTNNSPMITIVDYNNENVNVYEFEITQHYPFTPPKVKINKTLYNDFLRIGSITFLHLLKKLKKYDCFCCHSYLCAERWSPAITIKQFIEEIRMFRKCKRDIVNKKYADKIKDKYLIADIDLDSWLL